MPGRPMFRAALICGLLATAGSAPAATIPPSGQIPFSVFRNGDSPFGHHRMTFRQEGKQLIMEKEISFQVRAAFFTVFRYFHQNREVWENGRLVTLETSTNDDGKKYWVRGHATEVGFMVEGSGGTFIAPSDVIPTSYWNVATLKVNRMLDTQRGLMMDVRIDKVGEDPVSMPAGRIPATHYTINILTNKPGNTDVIDIWYEPSGSWVKLGFDAKGNRITYQLDPAGMPSGPLLQAAQLPPGAAAP